MADTIPTTSGSETLPPPVTGAEDQQEAVAALEASAAPVEETTAAAVEETTAAVAAAPPTPEPSKETETPREKRCNSCSWPLPIGSLHNLYSVEQCCEPKLFNFGSGSSGFTFPLMLAPAPFPALYCHFKMYRTITVVT